MKFQLTDSMESYLKDIENLSTLSTSEERDLFKQYRETKDAKIKDKLFKSCAKMVIFLAKKIPHKSSVLLEDMIQEGNLGLLRAIEKYDENLGFRLTTYASNWIYQFIHRFVLNTESPIRLPVRRREEIIMIGLNPEIKGEHRYRNILPYIQDVTSLDLCITEEGTESTFHDIIADTNNKSTESLAERNLINENMKKSASRCLTDIEMDVVFSHAGLNNDEKLTFEEIGTKYNRCKERIRQIEEKAIFKLKRNKEFKEFYYVR